LDLGFSALTLEAPEEFKDSNELLFTFVDCPGHNSLIRTIIGGNLIIGKLQKFKKISNIKHI
jgi:selenocysteine-specific elongation factor